MLPRRPVRSSRSAPPGTRPPLVVPVCAHCGAEYNGRAPLGQAGRSAQLRPLEAEGADEQGAVRRLPGEQLQAWYVDVGELESKIKALVVKERSSQEFELIVRDLILERDDFRKKAEESVALARADLERKQVA